MNKATALGSLPGKVVACALALVFLAVGAIGLVLPIIPGLLFLALAAFIIVKSFPALETLLRRHRGLDRHLDRADRMRHLSLGGKLRIAGLLCVKVLLDGLALVTSLVARLRDARGGAWRRPPGRD